MNTYPRETVEHQPLTVKVNGATVNQFDVAVVPQGVRPTGWAPCDVLDGKPGFMIDALPAGRYTVWVRVDDTPESPVIDAGSFKIT